VDIGCGMVAVRTQYHRNELPPRLSTLRTAIEAAVPLSAGKYNTEVTSTARPRIDALAAQAARGGFDPGRYAGNWELQLGSLGSGNHFIEVCADETGHVWLFLHSGSRGVGNKIAQLVNVKGD
jgi:tRNA-splicing ligase RtcB